MQNQSSPAQLLFPTVPNNYCPEGKWSDIFNSFIQLYLNNGTVNIPGLGQVTPAQIATINQNIQNLQNEYNALAVNVQTGTQTVTASSSTYYTITFGSPMPNANYAIIIEPQTSTTSGIANNWSWAIIASSKTTTQFQIYFYNPTTSITGFNWTVQSIAST
jgi:hypothetical protein